MTSFVQLPKLPPELEFIGDEKPILFLRQHWYIFRDPILLATFLPFLLLSGSFFIQTTGLPIWLKSSFSAFFLWSAFLSFIFALLFFLWRLFFWQGTFYILTSRRVMVVEQKGVFARKVQQATNANIMNVTSEVHGLAASLYGFGDVLVEVFLPGEEEALEFRRVPHPHKVQREVMKVCFALEDTGSGGGPLARRIEQPPG